jgi:hypothetical protein
LSTGSDVNSQLCVYVRGEKVIDLWGAAAEKYKPDPKYGPDTLQGKNKTILIQRN